MGHGHDVCTVKRRRNSTEEGFWAPGPAHACSTWRSAPPEPPPMSHQAPHTHLNLRPCRIRTASTSTRVRAAMMAREMNNASLASSPSSCWADNSLADPPEEDTLLFASPSSCWADNSLADQLESEDTLLFASPLSSQAARSPLPGPSEGCLRPAVTAPEPSADLRS